MPVSHGKFSVAGKTPDDPFVSTDELLTSGLLSEGLLVSSKGRSVDSAFRVRQALYLDPSNTRLQLTLALLLQQAGEGEEAREIFSRLYASQPRNPDVLVGYGDALLAARKHEEGKQKLKEAFKLFAGAGNALQAARIARSISNISFGIGDEQEALCYSYEALMLSPAPDQVAAHARLLVALNMYQKALQGIEQAQLFNAVVARSARIQHVRALALYALGRFDRAVDAEDIAIQYLSKEPELTSEVMAARWLAISKLDRSQDSEIDNQRYEEQRQDVTDYSLRAGVEVVFWPPDMRAALVALSEGSRLESDAL